MKIKITTDSVADLTQELYKQNDIEVIPLFVQLGDKECRDGVDVTPDQIYEYVAKEKKLPKTAALSQIEYMEKFENILNQGYDAIIHFNLSSEMSVTHQNALNASKEFKNVYVIDSRSLSTGVGLSVLYACELRDKGLKAEEIVEKVKARIPYVQASFIINKLDYLHKGGRCSSIALLGANLLKIKPSIEVVNGKMGMSKKYMGKFEKCIVNYVNDTLTKYNNMDTTRVFLTHTKTAPENIELIKNILKEKANFKEIIETTAGSTITSHCGENTIGILYFNDNN